MPETGLRLGPGTAAIDDAPNLSTYRVRDVEGSVWTLGKADRTRGGFLPLHDRTRVSTMGSRTATTIANKASACWRPSTGVTASKSGIATNIWPRSPRSRPTGRPNDLLFYTGSQFPKKYDGGSSHSMAPAAGNHCRRPLTRLCSSRCRRARLRAPTRHLRTDLPAGARHAAAPRTGFRRSAHCCSTPATDSADCGRAA